ncbi:positive regulator of sigma E, RseC/MucC [Alkaliphilus metalliredigens QYMF]|uniref:Positive regulator of sigma E, RseC/MucC n=1 Tax=Alkaliphilus metalliredigens (strain QYMF) TaxID=293826 RepID=A6TQP8_ALKMQ|nr:SoxR reducing system RseC family protein [Alkaliphilus metalliredigens]ABR48516.1 positive regulator of sigma E, RseC/MucC [Alkaliphilus metalliredigens QYMF]
MKQCGTVVSLEGKMAKVLMQRQASCGDCTACKMGQEEMKLEVKALNNANAQVGQRVEIDMEHQNVLAAAFIVYMIPLFALMMGIFAGNAMLSALGVENYRDLLTAFAGFIFMATSFMVIKIRENKFKTNKDFTPIISEIVE